MDFIATSALARDRQRALRRDAEGVRQARLARRRRTAPRGRSGADRR